MTVPQDDLAALVNAQAEDDGLWFAAQTAPEAYLQQELRRLHAAIEQLAQPPAVPVDLDALARETAERCEAEILRGGTIDANNVNRWMVVEAIIRRALATAQHGGTR